MPLKAKKRTAAQVAEDCTVFDKPIDLQKQDEDTERWETVQHMYAAVNKSGGREGYAAGADQFHARLLFRLRYFRGLEAIRAEPTLWRILYGGDSYQITDYDDYMERHRVVRLEGTRYV